MHAARVSTRGTGAAPAPAPANATGSTARTHSRHRKPATASSLPLVGLAGLLSLSAGLSLRAVRRSA